MPSTTEYRQVCTRAKVIDDNLNSWEYIAGNDINVDVAYRYPSDAGPDETDPSHWSYRGQAAMCALASGSILRARIGDGTTGNRNVYIQIISDPTDPDQWETWTFKYTGTHYAIAVERDDSTSVGYRIYTAKNTGLYVNNILKYEMFTTVVRIKPVAFNATPGFLYVQVVKTDSDGARAYEWWYTPNILATTPVFVADVGNYRWYRHDMVCFRGGYQEGVYTWYRFRSAALEGGSRNQSASEMLTSEASFAADPGSEEAGFNTYDRIRFLKGPSGQAGFRTITNLFMTSLPSSDGNSYYFLFYNERERDTLGNVMSNLKMPLYWSRSLAYPYYLSSPTPCGFSVWGFAGVVQLGDYIYLAGNGRVFRRPWRPTELDITNHVIDGGYENPRDNEKATGSLICANPDNILGSQLGITSDNPAGLTERRLWLEIGKRLPTSTEIIWKRDNSWWIKELRKDKQDRKRHLIIEFADFWHRLENRFAETISIPGRTVWGDWSDNGVNHLYNWTNDTDEIFRYNPSTISPDLAYTVPRLRTILSHDGPVIHGAAGGTVTQFAGWSGENARVAGILWQTKTGIVFRYELGGLNYFYVWAGSDRVELRKVEDGTDTLIAVKNTNIVAPFLLTVDFRWAKIKVLVNGVEQLSVSLTNPPIFRGYVGFLSDLTNNSLEVSNVIIYDFNQAMTRGELIRMLLAFAEEHAVTIDAGATSSEDIALIWGPQSDLETPAQALQKQLDAAKVQVKWIPD